MERAGVPERPAGVPDQATWIAESEHWELGETGPDGRKNGELRLWRADGSLYLRGRTAEGVQDGPFSLYHPNGQIAREGTYAGGEIDGLLTAYASDAPTPEGLRSCCVPANAWRMEARYERGRLLGEAFFDREAHALLSDGTPRPERPADLPADAEFLEWERRWAVGVGDGETGARGLWRYFTIDGRLDEEAEYRAGKKMLSRLFDAAGAIRQESHFVGDGVRHGSWRRRFVDSATSPWADPAVREERGAFDNGQTVGTWTFLDERGAVVRAVDHGRVFRDEDLPQMEVLSDCQRPASAWQELAGVLRGQGRAREAACAAARASAAGGDAAFLRAFLAETTLPASAETSARLCAEIDEATGDGLSAVLGALLGGADPAAVLRVLAARIKGGSRAALDFVTASILLAPERPMTHVTRALVRIERGDPDGARADADVVAKESRETAQFLGSYVKLLFPAFTFWPSREIPHSPLPDMPDAPEQPLSAVRRAIQVYATRLAVARAAAAAALGEAAAFLPPDMSRLLPDGPVVLQDATAAITDETPDGPVTEDVRIEETLAIEGAGIPVLMRLARRQWLGLCWLCWSSGLDEIALPTALAPPANFAHAVGMAIARCARAQDQVATGGLRSLTAGVPGFTWEDLDIDGMPAVLAEIARDEYLEMRAVFLFLVSPENLSPFQSDLRQLS